jgi:hypothetical protein
LKTTDAYFEYVNGEHFDDLVALFGPGAELRGPGTELRLGAVQIRDYYERAFAPWREHADRPTRTLEAGSTILIEVRFCGRLAVGTPIEFDAVDIFDLDVDGAIARLSSWYDSHWVRKQIANTEADR